MRCVNLIEEMHRLSCHTEVSEALRDIVAPAPSSFTIRMDRGVIEG